MRRVDADELMQLVRRLADEAETATLPLFIREGDVERILGAADAARFHELCALIRLRSLDS